MADRLVLTKAERVDAAALADPEALNPGARLTYSQPLRMLAFETALTVPARLSRRAHLAGEGIGNFIGEARPVVLHGVQQLMHEPLRLEAWPDDDHAFLREAGMVLAQGAAA